MASPPPFSPRKKLKKIDSAPQPEEEDEPQNDDQSQEDSNAATEEEEVNSQVQMGDDDIHREKKNLDAAEIGTNDQAQGSAQEESKEAVEREIKKLVDVLDISIQFEKKNLGGRTFSRHVRTQEYLDSLIRGHDPNLEDGLSRAMRDFLGEYTQYPDADFDSLVRFVTDFLGLIDVPSQDLVNLRHMMIAKLRNSFQAVTNETNAVEMLGNNFQAIPLRFKISDYKLNF